MLSYLKRKFKESIIPPIPRNIRFTSHLKPWTHKWPRHMGTLYTLDPLLGSWCLTPLSKKNISVILLRSVLLVEEICIPGENHRPAGSHWYILSHNNSIEYASPRAGFEFTTFVMIGSDCIGSCNYQMIATTTAL
jgi:hypothetical protein